MQGPVNDRFEDIGDHKKGNKIITIFEVVWEISRG